VDWQARAASYAARLTPALGAELAQWLGLPVAALAELPLLGYCPRGPHGGACFTFPEVDGQGALIGLHCRYENGSKKAWPSGRRGLTVPSLWPPGSRPLLLPEGASDVLALAALGLPAVGRPSNLGGIEHLTNLLRELPADVPLVVLAERDPKADGRWPGRDGAEHTAAELGARLRRPVPWTLPPDQAKDVRAWCLARRLPLSGPGVREHWQRAGEAFVAALSPIAPCPPKAVDPTAEQADAPFQYHFTDLGNARRVLARHGQDLRFCHGRKRWLVYDSRRWAEDATAEAIRRVKETQDALYAWASQRLQQLTHAQKGSGQEKERAEQLARLGRLLKHCLKWEDARDIARCLQLAASEPGVPVLPAQLDADPFILNCTNGTLNLRSGQLRPHCRQDHLTKLCPVAYLPEATCPLWEAFLRRILNAELTAYLQRVIGYALTGDVREQALWFLYGTGANGKSTFLGTVLALLGDYGMQAVSDLLLAKKNDTHPTERADLFGRRFVATIEIDDGKRLAEALMKQLTGGDKVRARRMRQDFFEFPPTWKLFLAANHKPTIRGTDLAAWRRIRLVPFTVTIPPEQQDRGLAHKLLAELPGILAWAVRGCLEWQRHGLQEPDEVRAATDSYRVEQDTLAAFLAACCTPHPELRVSASALRGSYEAWSGEKISPKVFATRMAERGFVSERGTGGLHFFRGLSLATATSDGSDGRSG
jgi:putative DNA primase/helicase